MILSVMWWILCIPIVTIGAATTSLFYIMTRRVTDREGYLFKDFFKSFKNNFKQSTLVWLILILIGLVLYTNISNMAAIEISPMLKMFLYPFQLLFFVELILNALYIFVIIARFDMKMKETFKTAVYMVHRHLLTTIMLVVLLIGVLLVGEMYPLFYVIAPGTYAFVTSYLFIKIFKKYRPEIDEDQYAEADKLHEEKLRLARIEERRPVSSAAVEREKEPENADYVLPGQNEYYIPKREPDDDEPQKN